jgi:hypothetical protein
MLSRIIAPSVAIMLLSSTAASAFTVFDVETSLPNNAGIVNVPGFGDPWTTPIITITTTGQTFIAYCADLFHNVTIEGNQDLTYTFGLVTTNGDGVAISEATSNIMGQLARDGMIDLSEDNLNGVVAAQAAIWDVEYGVHVTSGNKLVQSDITSLLADTHNDGAGFAHGFISSSGTQDLIFASPALAAPETSTWIMMALGFIGLGLAARAKRTPIATAL